MTQSGTNRKIGITATVWTGCSSQVPDDRSGFDSFTVSCDKPRHVETVVIRDAPMEGELLPRRCANVLCGRMFYTTLFTKKYCCRDCNNRQHARNTASRAKARYQTK